MSHHVFDPYDQQNQRVRAGSARSGMNGRTYGACWAAGVISAFVFLASLPARELLRSGCSIRALRTT